MDKKKCNKCNEIKSLSDYRDLKGKNGVIYKRNTCDSCRNKQRRDRHKNTGYWKKKYQSMSEEERQRYIKKKSAYNRQRLKNDPRALETKRKYDRSDKGVYARYRNDCNRRSRKKRGIKMLLKFEEFSEIINKPCIYCGKISRGVDRIDSSKSYTIENSVPCCKICNQMKNDMEERDFISHIKSILKVWESKNDVGTICNYIISSDGAGLLEKSRLNKD